MTKVVASNITLTMSVLIIEMMPLKMDGNSGNQMISISVFWLMDDSFRSTGWLNQLIPNQKHYGKSKINWACVKWWIKRNETNTRWNETQIWASQILELTECKPTIVQRVGKNDKTHWMVFYKDADNDSN